MLTSEEYMRMKHICTGKMGCLRSAAGHRIYISLYRTKSLNSTRAGSGSSGGLNKEGGGGSGACKALLKSQLSNGDQPISP